MPNLPDPVLWSIPAFILLTVVELVSFLIHPDEEEVGYAGRDTATSLSMGLGSLFTNLLWKIPTVTLYGLAYSLTPLRIGVHWATVPLMLLLQDFCYYWSHRSNHRVRLLWAQHVVHHSSRHYNLSTALRQPWTDLSFGVFYLPMVLLGISPAAVAFCGSVSLVYQFWIHTERIDRLGRPIEAVLNTPSHHRVHHASQGGYLDRNFGGILIVWDRLFRTFTAETERPVYGLTKNISSFNPLRVATHEYASIGHDLATAQSWRARLGYLFRGPGWTPTPLDTTTATTGSVEAAV
ncbi:sterol desaturase family protein [Streptacidiphilus pinicola]|uniref:Sterol desaturase family protein n=1 Tax=Streptacidiphilus pinicola TaxID=2219663 RepID=A0A2X0IBE1_9ACTN|nr:sterol desaturase family protein [Streptacidiphilus pinicola]RAG80953.1 sterol desaturase family protein [Streptacidiphilus pinicola]